MESVRQFMCDMVMNPGAYKEYRRTIGDTGFKLDKNAGNWKYDEAVEKINSFLKSQGIEMSFNDYVMQSFHGRRVSANEFFTA